MTEELLELREAEGAFERIEEWLRARGFFAAGGDELVADLYLGYGLSDTIRRDRSTPPPPSRVLSCRLRHAACVEPRGWGGGSEGNGRTVEGRLRDDVGPAEILRATFPGGSVTGAPKIAAVDLIAELEPVGRGASMGAIGRVHGNGDLELALTIRTFAIAAGAIHLWVGGGIVWDSDPATEVEESWVKARPLLDAIGARLPEAALA